MSIRNCFCLVVLFTIFSFPLSAQPEIDLKYEKKVVQLLEQDWFEALKEKDVDEFLCLFAENAQWLPANAPSIKGHKKIRERIESFFNDPSFDWSIYSVKVEVEISSSGDLAVVYNYVTEPVKMRWMNVWKKINDEWKCIIKMDNSI